MHSKETVVSNMLKLAIVLAAAAVCCVESRNTYYLYTRNNPDIPEFIAGFDASLAGSNFDLNDKTIILIHGHGGSFQSIFNTLIKQKIIMYREPYNIVVVDWEVYASLSYSSASARVHSVGFDLANFIETQLIPRMDVSTLHVVGFGLGAHVAGIASRELRSGTVGRITGLDPSGSGWGSNSLRLRASDASYVEVIHTDGSGLLANGIGTAIGHINFYANGGNNQPGCLTHACSHNRAYELFAASIFNTSLVGFPCSSTTAMNLNLCRGSPLKMGGTELDKRGQTYIYRINTRRNYPF